MGGHGTLVIGLRNPETFHTLSLLAPSCNAFSWGKEIIFDIFLGNDEELQSQYNPVKVIPSYNGPFREILVDVVCKTLKIDLYEGFTTFEFSNFLKT